MSLYLIFKKKYKDGYQVKMFVWLGYRQHVSPTSPHWRIVNLYNPHNQGRPF